MAGRKFTRGSREFEMFTDYWKLCQKHWIPERTDEYWETVISAISAFEKKYREIGLARKLGNALASDIEERYKRENEDVNPKKK